MRNYFGKIKDWTRSFLFIILCVWLGETKESENREKNGETKGI